MMVYKNFTLEKSTVDTVSAGIVIDYLNTGANVMLMIFQIACDAKRLDRLDRNILLGR